MSAAASVERRVAPEQAGRAPGEWREVPGPRSRELLERQEARESSARTYPRSLPLAIERAEGTLVEDADGNLYLDFLTGAGVLSLGHNHPDVVAAVERQLRRVTHGLDFPTAAKDAFTTRQLAMLPPALRDEMLIHFCGPTGADAVEAAIKLCKTATGRSTVVAFHGGYHGCTNGAMSLTGLVAPKRQVANLMPGVHFFPFAYCHRCPLGLRRDSCEINCAAYLERVLRDPNGGVDLPAAVLVEPVQGEGGTIPAPPEFLQRLRAITAELEIPLVVDEVQSGCGRTGTWFAFEQAGIEPDVIVASKALGGIGTPIAAIFYRRELDTWAPGAHIGTFRGNQLAFAAGVAALDVIERDDVLTNVRMQGDRLLSALRAHCRELRIVSDVRGVGLMLGVELESAGAFDAASVARELQRRVLARGLIVERGGRNDVVLRLLPPLNVSSGEVEVALSILCDELTAVDDAVTEAA
jgi:diaminobutyrate-2-oxoglutarate transaminase